MNAFMHRLRPAIIWATAVAMIGIAVSTVFTWRTPRFLSHIHGNRVWLVGSHRAQFEFDYEHILDSNARFLRVSDVIPGTQGPWVDNDALYERSQLLSGFQMNPFRWRMPEYITREQHGKLYPVSIRAVQLPWSFDGMWMRTYPWTDAGQTTPEPGTLTVTVHVPHWAPFLLCAGVFWFAFRPWWRQRRMRRRFAKGLCTKCGYDLRAHAPGCKCPECGTAVPAASGIGAATPPA